MATGDEALVRAAQEGDKAAFARLFTRHLPLLRALCLRALGDPGLVEDAVQEAALQALLGIDRLRQPDRFGPWLAGIGLNICRRWQREQSRPVWSWDALAGGRTGAGTAVPADPVETLIEAVEQRNEVRRAIAALPPGQREAVVLFYLSGMTCAETAAMLGIAPGAVKTRLHKARRRLGEALAETQEEPMNERINRRTLTRAAGALTAMAALEHQGTAAAAEDQMTTSSVASGDFVDMRVVDVRRLPAKEPDGPRAHVVILAEVDGDRRLPIWVGEPEGTAIALHLEGVETPRPMTFAFTAAMLTATGSQLTEVRIDRLAETVFYATAVIDGPTGVQRVDARPSDALNLALIAGAPIRVAADVLAQVAAAPESSHLLHQDEGEGAAAIVAGVRATWSRTLPSPPTSPE
jgi:RNA polymerase sigma factor (sigma-70 family)